MVSSKQILLSGWLCKHVEKVRAPVSPAYREVATVTCLSGAGSTGRGQSLLLLLQGRPKIGEHAGCDTKTGFIRSSDIYGLFN